MRTFVVRQVLKISQYFFKYLGIEARLSISYWGHLTKEIIPASFQALKTPNYIFYDLNSCIIRLRSSRTTIQLLISLFGCLGFFVPLENFSLIWKRHHYWWMSANFGLCSALMAIEQCGFFSVLHLMWHDIPFIMVISKDPWHSRLAVKLSPPVFTTWVRRGWDSNTQPSACWANALMHYATAAVQFL